MNDRKPENAASIDAELTNWLLAHDRGLTKSEVEAFDAWLVRSPAHGLAWAEAATLWESFDHAEEDAEIAAMLDDARRARPATRSEYFHPRRLAVGGGLLVAAALAWLVGVPRQLPSGEPQSVAHQDYATGTQTAQYRLTDGTNLTLDAGSALSFASDGKARSATLVRGRAYLEIGHDARRPFSIRAGGATITDEGTAFGVASGNGALSVTLVSGKVAILDPSTGAAAIRLVPGQQFERLGTTPGAVSAVNPDSILSWREGFLEFDRVPLAAAMAEMNRYTAQPVRIADPEAGEFLVSGRFRAGDPQRFARVLALTFPVRLVPDPQGRPTLRSRR